MFSRSLIVTGLCSIKKRSQGTKGSAFFVSSDPGYELFVILQIIVLKLIFQSLGVVIGFLILGSGLIVSG